MIDSYHSYFKCVTCTVLYNVLYYTALHCTVLYYTILRCTALYCTVLHCTALYCTALYCTLLSFAPEAFCRSLNSQLFYFSLILSLLQRISSSVFLLCEVVCQNNGNASKSVSYALGMAGISVSAVNVASIMESASSPPALLCSALLCSPLSFPL